MPNRSEPKLRRRAKQSKALAEIQRFAATKKLNRLSLRQINREIDCYRRGRNTLALFPS